MLSLNESAARLADRMEADAERLRVAVTRSACGARLIDCGVAAPGGLEAGLRLAEVCLADLGAVSPAPGRPDFLGCPDIVVRTDHPVAACMASQYAGWQLAEGKFFAMGSGPMRAAAGKEALFAEIKLGERPKVAVGVLETGKLPPDELCRRIAADCQIAPDQLTLLCARTASLAGSVQVVARSVETCLHKLHTLKFDLGRVVSGLGYAPLPPVAKDDLSAIGRTNDAVLYGGEVMLWVRGDDESIVELGPHVPSSSSTSFGQTFGDLFTAAGGDFYKIDPLLFSPARVTFFNLDTGRHHAYGRLRHDVFARSAAV